MLKKSIPGIIKNAVCIGLSVVMVTGCGTAKAEEATGAVSYENSAEETSNAEATIEVALEENEITETEQDEVDPIEISSSEENEISEEGQAVFGTIELSAIKKETDVKYFEKSIEYEGKTYICDDLRYNGIFPAFPIDREFHSRYLEWEGAEYVVLYSMLIKDEYIYYTIDDRSEGQGMVPRLQLWKASLTGGEPKLLYNTCYGECNLAMFQDQIVLTDHETMKTLIIDLDGNVKAEIAKNSYLIAATNEKIYVSEWNGRDVVALDYSGNELQRFSIPYRGYTGEVKIYNGAPIFTMANEDPYGAYFIPDEGNNLLEIVDMQDKGCIYDLTDDGFYYVESGSLCFYSGMDKQTTQLFELDGNLEYVWQVRDRIIYETGQAIEYDNACYYQCTVCEYNMTTKESETIGIYYQP